MTAKGTTIAVSQVTEQLRDEFKRAFLETGVKFKDSKAKFGFDADYLCNKERVTTDTLIRGLAALGRTVEFRVYDPDSGPVLPRFQALDTSEWEI